MQKEIINKEQINEAIILWLIHNVQKVKQLIKPFQFQLNSLLKSTENEFHYQIKKDYLDVIKSEICIEITKNLGVQTDSVLELLESFDLEDYLRG